jgi:hypothetical protein
MAEKTLLIRMVNPFAFLERLPSVFQDHSPELLTGDRTFGPQGKSKRPG